MLSQWHKGIVQYEAPCVNQVQAAAITFSIYKIYKLQFFRTDKVCFMKKLFWNFFGIISFYIIPYDGSDNDLAFQL